MILYSYKHDNYTIKKLCYKSTSCKKNHNKSSFQILKKYFCSFCHIDYSSIMLISYESCLSMQLIEPLSISPANMHNSLLLCVLPQTIRCFNCGQPTSSGFCSILPLSVQCAILICILLLYNHFSNIFKNLQGYMKMLK